MVYGLLGPPTSSSESVPQGSPLSPVLYSMGSSNFSASVQASFSIQYIDDSAVGCRGPTVELAVAALGPVNDRIVRWSGETSLSFNASKSVVVVFTGNRVMPIYPRVVLGGLVVPIRSHTRYLGVVLDSRLRWDAHIAFLLENLRDRLRLIRILTSRTWGATLKSFEWSLLRLSSRGWISVQLFYGSAAQNILRPIEVEFHRGLRQLKGLPRSTFVKSLYVEAQCIPLSLRQEQVVLSLYVGFFTKVLSWLADSLVGMDAVVG